MKKKILSLIGAIAIIALMAFNIQFTTNANSGSFALSSLVMQAFADGEGGYSCSASADCYHLGVKTGSVSCTGSTNCSSGVGYVTCDGISSACV